MAGLINLLGGCRGLGPRREVSVALVAELRALFRKANIRDRFDWHSRTVLAQQIADGRGPLPGIAGWLVGRMVRKAIERGFAGEVPGLIPYVFAHGGPAEIKAASLWLASGRRVFEQGATVLSPHDSSVSFFLGPVMKG